MTTRIVTFVSLLAFSAIAIAQPNYAKLAKTLYPASQEDQAFTAKFFDIVEAHKTADPFFEGKGPSIKEYSLDKMRFSFVTNSNDTTVDLVIFNWTLPTFKGLELDPSLSEMYGSKVYVLKDVLKKSLGTQGADRRQLTNFSYMFGANYMARQILRTAPAGYQVPEQFKNWKAHADYMDSSEPLRQALDSHNLALLSPSKSDFFNGYGIPESSRPLIEKSFAQQGGFQNMMMGTMVHEMFHVKSGEDKTNGLASDRGLSDDRDEVIKQLQSDATTRALLATYVRIVFSIGDNLISKIASTTEPEQLADLKAVIAELKATQPDVWKFVWNYEYDEGFAEYVSAYSMVQVGVTSLSQKIDLEKNDSANNFAYRTGAIGGLYLSHRLHQMSFANNEDQRESVWEIILRLTNPKSSNQSLEQIATKYQNVPGVDGENEVKRVIDYLVSTIKKSN